MGQLVVLGENCQGVGSYLVSCVAVICHPEGRWRVGVNLSAPATTVVTRPEASRAPAMLSVRRVQGIPSLLHSQVVSLEPWL